MNIRKTAALLMSAVLGMTIPVFPQWEAAASEGVENIVARADYLYNLAWTAQTDVKGWRNKYTFEQGTTHHIPYAQADDLGGFLYFDADFETFLEAAADADSVFYTKQAYSYDNPGSYSTYYGLDCSSMVSYCWELAKRTETPGFPSLDVTSCGKCTAANVSGIEIGDAINKTYSHVVLVTDILRNQDGTVNSYEITEQTTYEMKRTIYTPEELVERFSAYTILRYNQRDAVTPPPDSGNAVELNAAAGTSATETLLTWETAIADPDQFSVRIWSAAYSDVTPYYTESGLTAHTFGITLPAGVYEVRVDAVTTGGIPFESNTVSLTVRVEEPEPGDVNGDGEITAADASLVLTAIAEHATSGTYGLDDAQMAAADVDGNGELTPGDAAVILLYIAECGVSESQIAIADLIG